MRSSERGYVTAEAALVIPSVVLVLGMCLWGLAAAGAQAQCGDAARAGARAVARGEAPEDVRATALGSAPPGAEVRVTPEGGLYRVEVTARSNGPGPLGVRLAGEAVAHAEDG